MATKLRLTIRFAGVDSHHPAKPTKNLKKRLKERIENPDTLESYDVYSGEYLSIPAEGSKPLTDPAGTYYEANYKYIVITNNSLATISDPYSFQTLCDSKTARGIPAGIVTTEWIFANYDGTKPSSGTDDATELRNFLIDAYETWVTEYALLGGDKDIIPVRLLYDTGYGVAADLYYGCVDPSTCTFDDDADGEYGESNDGSGGSTIGPELGFGHIMGYYHDEPVLIIKTSQGNRNLGWDFLPPGSEQYIYGDYTYAGYGDSPSRWLTGTTPEPID